MDTFLSNTSLYGYGHIPHHIPASAIPSSSYASSKIKQR